MTMNTTSRLGRTRHHEGPCPELGSPTATPASTPGSRNDRLVEPQPADHYADMLQVIEAALEEDGYLACAGRPTLRQLQAQAASADLTLVTRQDCSGLLIRKFTVRVEPHDILPFETLAEAKTLLDLEMGACT